MNEQSFSLSCNARETKFEAYRAKLLVTREKRKTKPDIQPAFPLIHLPMFEVSLGGLEAKQIN